LYGGKGTWVRILLTGTKSLDSYTKRYLQDNAIKDVIIIGSEKVISNNVITQIKNLTQKPNVTRWSGGDRYATAQDVLKKATTKWGLTPSIIGLASGSNFPDALVGGAAIGNRGGVLVITDPDKLSAHAKTAITAHKSRLTDVEIFGSTKAIRVEAEVRGLLK
jgi:putative cell wall-binding protein